MNLDFLRIIVHSKAFKRATHFESDYLGCVQPSSSKDDEAQQKFYSFDHSTAYFEGSLARNVQTFATRPNIVLFIGATRDNDLPIEVGMCLEYYKYFGDARFFEIAGKTITTISNKSFENMHGKCLLCLSKQSPRELSRDLEYVLLANHHKTAAIGHEPLSGKKLAHVLLETPKDEKLQYCLQRFQQGVWISILRRSRSSGNAS